MKLKPKNIFTKTIRHSLLIIPSFLLMLPATAQTDEEESDEDKITITGSRIKRSEYEGANPVTVISRIDFEKSTATNLGEFLQTMPSSSGSPLGTKTNNGGNGSATVDRRGMGATRTLTLIDGKRTVDGGDLQTIPLTMVERVEILKDGASAIYGADAVAGVINIITRTDFDGTEVTAELSDYQDVEDGGQRVRLGVISGINSGKGNITWGIEWDEQQKILQGDTKYDMYNYPLYVLDPTQFTSYHLPSVNDPAVVPFGSSRSDHGVFNLSSGGGAVILMNGASGTNSSDFRPATLNLAPGNDLWNYAPVNYIQTPFERLSVFTSGNYELNNNANIYMRFKYNHRVSDTLLAPLPYDTNIYPGYTFSNGAPGIPAENYYNPFGEDVVRARRRMVETGGRNYLTEVNQYQATLGLNGYVFSTDWEYDFNITSGERTRIDTDYGQFSGTRLNNALGPSFMDENGNIVCGTPDNVIAGCVPLNLFGNPGSISQQMLNYVAMALNDRSEASLLDWSASLTGEAFDLPAGPVPVSFGVERRDEWVGFVPDSAKALGAATGGTAVASEGRYNTETVFFETSIPILADVPAAKNLDLNIGARYDDNSLFGNQTTFQAGIRWQPYDGLLIRATSSDVFRAPTISALFAGQSQGATPTVNDPCNQATWSTLSTTQIANCTASGVPNGGWNQTDTQLTQTNGGNPNLNAEEGTTQTFGIAWSPEFIEGLNLTLDWWKIELDGGIQAISAQNSLNLCANFGQYCNNITRDITGNLGEPGAVTNINAFVQNVASEVAEGYDLEATYSFDTELGSFRTRLIYSHLLDRQQVPFEGGQPLELVGVFDPGLDASFPEDKFKLSTDWMYNSFFTSLSMDYIGKINVPFSFVPGSYNTDAVYYFDLQTSYTLGTGTKLTFAIQNLTDEDPVYIESGFNTNSDEATYRILGRQFMLRVSHHF